MQHDLATPLAALAALGLAVLAGPARAEPPTFRDLSIEQRPIASLAAPAGDLKVGVFVDRKDDTYRIGDTVTISVRTNRDAYISIINVGSSGKVHVLFPNRHHPENRVAAHQVLEIPAGGAPYSITAGAPAGHDLVKVVATVRPHRIADEARLADAGPFRSFQGTPEVLARDLTLELAEQSAAVPEGGAAVAEKVIRIVAGN